MVTNEEIDRIESSSDLKFPDNTKVQEEPKDQEKESNGFSFKEAIFGGVASGVAFFSVSKLVNWLGDNVELQDQDEDLEELEDEDQETQN